MTLRAPHVDDEDFRLYVGDVREVLAEMPERSVHMVVTSPPYYGLRDYGTGAWEGGDPACDHVKVDMAKLYGARANSQREGRRMPDDIEFSDRCGKCGALRVDSQIGLEQIPDCGGWATGQRCGECYVCHMVDVFRGLRRVLRDDGTAWLNLGDSFATDHAQKRSATDDLGRSLNTGIHASIEGSKAGELRGTPQGLKPKDLMGIPWRVAFALQADGWWLRQDNIWSKTSCMPESIEGAMWEPHYVHVGEKGARKWTPCPGCAKCKPNDGWIQSWGSGRTTKSHEYMFQLAKSSTYYYDVEALREPFTGTAYNGGIGAYNPPYAKHGPQSSARQTLDGSPGEALRGADGRRVTTVVGMEGSAQHRDGERWPNPDGKNKRSVWEVDTDEPTHRGQAAGATGKTGRTRGDGDDAPTTWSNRTTERGTVPSYTKQPREPVQQETLDGVEPPEPPRDGVTYADRLAAGEKPQRWRGADLDPSVKMQHMATPDAGRNKRSVWVLGPEPYSEAHFATFPTKLIIPPIKAGTSEHGVCATCGAPWLRMMERIGGNRSGRTPEQQRVAAEHGVTSADGRTLITGLRDEDISEKVTHGWKPSCSHGGKPVPATVLDPFMGSGTTALVARKLGRHAVGIELNPEYAELIAERTKQLSLLADGAW